MRTAIVISGNLRTFLMPTRENPNIRLCDAFIQNIVSQNDVDIFVYTDTNDFYYNDTQYYATDKQIEILNNNSYRMYNKIDFISNNDARSIILTELNSLLGSNLKSIHIENPFDVKLDPKYKLLEEANVKGSSPVLLIHQFRKLKLAYALCKQYEIENNVSYETLVKWRFDISMHGNLKFNNYNYQTHDVYVAGIHPPIIYDWHAFGNRKGMDLCLSLYDKLGSFIDEGRVYLCDLCGTHNHTNCSTHGYSSLSEITLAPEYHLFKTFQMNNIKLHNSGYPACPYRYQNMDTTSTVDSIINNLNIDASVVSYTSGTEINKQTYEKK